MTEDNTMDTQDFKLIFDEENAEHLGPQESETDPIYAEVGRPKTETLPKIVTKGSLALRNAQNVTRAFSVPPGNAQNATGAFSVAPGYAQNATGAFSVAPGNAQNFTRAFSVPPVPPVEPEVTNPRPVGYHHYTTNGMPPSAQIGASVSPQRVGFQSTWSGMPRNAQMEPRQLPRKKPAGYSLRSMPAGPFDGNFTMRSTYANRLPPMAKMSMNGSLPRSVISLPPGVHTTRGTHRQAHHSGAYGAPIIPVLSLPRSYPASVIGGGTLAPSIYMPEMHHHPVVAPPLSTFGPPSPNYGPLSPSYGPPPRSFAPPPGSIMMNGGGIPPGYILKPRARPSSMSFGHTTCLCISLVVLGLLVVGGIVACIVLVQLN